MGAFSVITNLRMELFQALKAALKVRARAVLTFHYYSTIQSADNPDKSTRLPYHFNRVTLSSVALLPQIYPTGIVGRLT